MNLGHGTLLGVMADAVKAFVDGEVEQIVRLIKGEISNLAEFGGLEGCSPLIIASAVSLRTETTLTDAKAQGSQSPIDFNGAISGRDGTN